MRTMTRTMIFNQRMCVEHTFSFLVSAIDGEKEMKLVKQ